MIEVWKDIIGYEGKYKISNLGNVLSLFYRNTTDSQLLKPTSDKDGYLTVMLSKNNTTKRCRVHRLVATAFISEVEGLTQINHKDENKANNEVNNLEWCDHKYNNTYGNKMQNILKPVAKLDLDGNILQTYSSIIAAEKLTGIANQCIGKCCKQKRKTAGGYKWTYIIK